MNPFRMKSDCDVAVVGAGPYGLAAAAHLEGGQHRDARVRRGDVVLEPEHAEGHESSVSLIASDISDPDGKLSFRAYADQHPMQWSYPVPLDDFVRYGEWFQVRGRRSGPAQGRSHRDRRRIVCLTLQDGERVAARRVVMAMGLADQEFRPAAFAGLPGERVSHACDHSDLSPFRGKRVAVMGRGQSACESAAILNDVGADVALVSRGDVHWLGGLSADDDRPSALIWKMHELMSTKSGVGPFPFNWLAEFPDVVRKLPDKVRAHSTRVACGRAPPPG